MAQPFEQAKGKEDPVSISVVEMLKNSSTTSPQSCISRVPNYLRQVNEKAYEPQLISIGPYHRGKDHLKAMEERKLGFLRQLVEETKDVHVSDYVAKMKELFEQARGCYEQPLSLDSDDFVKMMLIDGCFIVQLIRLFLHEVPQYLKDLFESYPNGFFLALVQDILLVENQLPFFVIWEIFAMIEPRIDREIKAFEATQSSAMNIIQCALELEEYGIEFKTIEGNSMFDIRFENKTLCIPKIVINDYTESFLRNHIAFEQLFVSDRDLHHASDYMMFIDSLIDSPKDVEILRQNGILDNMLGDDEAVAAMINSLGIYVMNSQNFYYSGVFNDVNEYCSKAWNKWMANLKHNYFNNPWSLISLLAAALLLLLTVLQTIFSLLSYYQ
ncbi:Detected protein of unknown function [Hibiscus syriacus]|uniref:Uncharacterized protein n=1 Tax=Hibiscus syriacus TaxID=106335 RepID=A0A6A3CXC9_HIBSY|nr:Detected protein of unknown function [Hibiscus syriacus]